MQFLFQLLHVGWSQWDRFVLDNRVDLGVSREEVGVMEAIGQQAVQLVEAHGEVQSSR